MKIKNEDLKKVNMVMGIILVIIIIAIVIYRLLNPVPSLEKRGCMDRLNKVAMFQAKYFEKNGRYADKLEELSRDNKLHYYHQCPLTYENFIIVSDSVNYVITCEKHNLFVENGILKKK